MEDIRYYDRLAAAYIRGRAEQKGTFVSPPGIADIIKERAYNFSSLHKRQFIFSNKLSSQFFSMIYQINVTPIANLYTLQHSSNN